MRSLVLFALFASPVFAFEDPGYPTWSCYLRSACDSSNGSNRCVSVGGPPMGFELRTVENEENKYTLEGLYGVETPAVVFSLLKDARDFVENDRTEGQPPTILVPKKLMADARGFSAHTIAARGTGERFIMSEYLLISCGRVPEQ